MILSLLVHPAFAQAFFVERFDTGQLPAGWKEVVGAQTGGGPVSKYTFEDGTLVFRATEKSKRFPSITHKMEIRDIEWLKVQARMKTEAVDPSRAFFKNCQAFVQFEDGPIIALPVGSGTTEWTDVTRIVPVPKSAMEVTFGFFLSMPGTVWFDDLIVEAVNPAWHEKTRGQFVYHWLGSTDYAEEAITQNDEDYARIAAFLGIPPSKTVHYYRYPDAASKLAYTGNAGNGHTAGNAVHSLFRTHAHELAHVLAREWGSPNQLLSEGLAVHLSGAWQGKDIHLTARDLLAAGGVPLLSELLDDHRFGALGENTAYPVAAAFVEWIVATKGVPGLKAAYVSVKPDASAAEQKKVLEAALGMSLADADAAFRASM